MTVLRRVFTGIMSDPDTAGADRPVQIAICEDEIGAWAYNLTYLDTGEQTRRIYGPEHPRAQLWHDLFSGDQALPREQEQRHAG